MLVTMNVASNRILIVNFILLCILQANCGRVKRVVGGIEVECGTQPRVVSLRNASTMQHLCGATLLSHDFAVTAAHCVKTEQRYVLQLDNLCEDEPSKAVVQDVFVHDDYNKYTRAHDIALMKISLDSEQSWLIKTLLPVSSFGISGDCILYGYGVRNVGASVISDQLISASVKIVSLDECHNKLGPFMAPKAEYGMMCALGDETDSCQGDSGGPLLCSGELQGVISHGVGCGVAGLPSVLTSIGQHRSWIDDVINGA